MKAEVFQVCHNYYSSRLDLLDSDMRSSQLESPPRIDYVIITTRASDSNDAQNEFL